MSPSLLPVKLLNQSFIPSTCLKAILRPYQSDNLKTIEIEQSTKNNASINEIHKSILFTFDCKFFNDSNASDNDISNVKIPFWLLSPPW